MITRRKLLVGFGLGTLLAAFPSLAQQAKVPRIGVFWIKEEGSAPYLAALHEGLRAHGYVEGRNFQIDDRFLVAGYESYPEAAAKLVRERPDVIVTYGATAALSARKATSSIPIVIIAGGDPVKLGLAASLSRPGGNVTGVTFITLDLSGKRLELLREIAPGARRIALVYAPGSQAAALGRKSYEEVAAKLGLDLRAVEVNSPEEIVPVISGITKANADAIAFQGSTMLTMNRRQVAAAVQKTGLPAVYSNSDFVEAGGLLAYATNTADGVRRAAAYVDKILKGAKPAELPIEQPTTFALAVNLKTARAMGIAIPKSLLVRADRVIE